MKLIGITGRKGSGKDTFAQALYPLGFQQVRFADPLKDMLAVLFTSAGYAAADIERLIDGDLKEMSVSTLGHRTTREAMQTLGTEWGRRMMTPDLWSNIAVGAISRLEDLGHPGVVVTDVRFPDELACIKRLGGTVVRVLRPQALNDFSYHSSEQFIDTLKVDVEVHNIGTVEALHEAAHQIADRLELVAA